MLRRSLEEPLRDALSDARIVLLTGARQSGKTTLVEGLREDAAPRGGRRYLTFDDAATQAAAHADPAGFVAGLSGPIALDEIQRVPELFPALKVAVDRDRSRGRFLLTGSANVLLLPRLSESLAGRMQVLTLWPLSQGEIAGVRESFVDALFAEHLPELPKARPGGADLAARIASGGYPEIVTGRRKARPSAWFGSYVTTILQRDVREMSSIEGLAALPRLLAAVASRQMALLSFADLARTVGLSQSTAKRYLALLQATFLVETVPAWYRNIGKRLAKSPKVLVADSGLAAHLQGQDAVGLRADRDRLGPLLEAFVAMEIKKQAGWSRAEAQLFHFRSSAGQEVDLVLEDRAGRVVGMEVKASTSASSSDFKGLRVLAEAAGRHFRRGIVLYSGDQVLSFGKGLYAVPTRALWDWSA